MTKLIKFIVQSGDNSVSLLQYLDKNIKSINNIGIRVRIVKLDDSDEDMIEELEKNGITRLPVMIDHNGNIHAGVDRIVRLLNKCIHKVHIRADLGPRDDDLTEYYKKAMFGGDGDQREEDEDAFGGEPNFERALTKHRQARQAAPQPRTPSRQINNTRPPARQVEELPDEPNIVDVPITMPAGGNDVDQEMLAAWMNNNID